MSRYTVVHGRLGIHWLNTRRYTCFKFTISFRVRDTRPLVSLYVYSRGRNGRREKKKKEKKVRERTRESVLHNDVRVLCNSWKSVKCFGPLFTSSSWCTAVQVHFFDSPVKNVLFAPLLAIVRSVFDYSCIGDGIDFTEKFEIRRKE